MLRPETIVCRFIRRVGEMYRRAGNGHILWYDLKPASTADYASEALIAGI